MNPISKPWEWNAVSDDYWLLPAEESYYLAERWRREKTDPSLLDLGCGLGRHSIFFANNGFKVSAFDLSVEGVRRWEDAAKQLSINVSVGDMLQLPYADDSFDNVFAMHTIYHADAKGIRQTIAEIRRVLKPGGELFVTMCSKTTPKFAKGLYRQLDECTVVKDDPPEKDVPHYYINLNDLLDLFADFTLDSIRHVEECLSHGRNPNISWHYFVLGRNNK